ncbi:MAG: hypothetical protein ACREA0_24670 [bacterium]
MPLNPEDGKRILQMLTSRYNDRRWRKKIEKTLSLPPTGVEIELQRAIFLYLKVSLKVYKSRRADPDTCIIGGFPTLEAIERAKFKPELVGPLVTKDDVAFLGSDPGPEVDEAWWEEMLVNWFDVPEEEKPEEEDSEQGDKGEEVAKAESEKAPARDQAAEKKPELAT